MTCFDEKDWLNFLSAQVSADVNDEMIDHLRSCEKCKEVYIMCVERNLLNTDDGYSKEVLSKLKCENKNKFIKYLIAASITLFLYSVGVFDHVLLVSDKFKNEITSISYSLNNFDFNLNNIWRSLYNNEKK